MSKIADKKSVLLVTVITSFLVPFMSSSVNIALPTMADELSMDALHISWVATAYLLATAMFLVPFGKIADIYGRKKVFLTGLLVYTIASMLIGLSNEPTILISFRFVQGVGAAMIVGTGIALITSVFPRGERGKALGINVSAVYGGVSVGPFIGGMLTHYVNWQSIFFMNIPLGIIIIFTTVKKIKGEWSERRGEKFDYIGAVLYSSSLATIICGLSVHKEGYLLILIGALLIIFFVFWELKHHYPVLEIHLFRKNRMFAYSNASSFINYCATFASFFLLSLYLQYILKFSPRDAGIILIVQPIIQSLMSPIAGSISDKVEPRIISSVGMIFSCISLFLLSFIGRETSLLYVLFSLIIFGVGMALFSSPNTNAIMSSVSHKYYGTASATLSTMRIIGQTMSMGIAMLIFSAYIGNIEISSEVYPHFISSLNTCFLIFSSLCFVGIFVSLSRGDIS